VKTLSVKFGNVFVTVTKSGKLQKETYEQFLDSEIKRYVKKNNFVLILDSWGGQMNPSLYDEKFAKNNDSTYSLKIILLKCTPVCQPDGVYFYGQVKNYIAKFENCLVLLAGSHELSARRDYKNACTHTSPVMGACLQKYQICMVCC
jgi:hypothetical protein